MASTACHVEHTEHEWEQAQRSASLAYSLGKALSDTEQPGGRIPQEIASAAAGPAS